MRRSFFTAVLLITSCFAPLLSANTTTPASAPAPSSATVSALPEPGPSSETFDADQPFSDTDSDLVPTSAFTIKKPYDQARDVLQKAVDLWKQHLALKTSDTALEAYDDLMEVHLPRRPKSARKKLRAERHLAAQLYVESSVAFIKQDAERSGNTAAAKLEARKRLGDLHDVSREYLELQKQVVNAIMELQ